MSEYRWMQGQRPAPRLVLLDTAEFQAAQARLEAILGGNDRYYEWAKTLPIDTITSRCKYLEAIRGEIAYRECVRGMLEDSQDQQRTNMDIRYAGAG